MKRNIFCFCFCFCIHTSYSQIPDSLRITLNDTIRRVEDCNLIIYLSRIDRKKFYFAKDFIVGDDSRNADLIYSIERYENDKFKEYRCKKSPISMPGLPDGPIRLRKTKLLKIHDRLEDLFCIERGKYRLQILYNNRNDGGYNGLVIQSKSNWVLFYVDSDIIYLDSPNRRECFDGQNERDLQMM